MRQERVHDHCGAGAEGWAESFGFFLHRRRKEILARLIDGRAYSSALDVGCGAGLLVEMGLSSSIGIDVREEASVTVYASAQFLPFNRDSFDLVFAGEVIEHLAHPSDALRDWVRVLKLGGTLILSTPNGVLVEPAGGHPEHQYTFSASEVKKALKGLGLTVNYSRGVYTGLLSGKRVFNMLRFARLKMAVLRFPVPLSLSYDVFIRARKRIAK